MNSGNSDLEHYYIFMFPLSDVMELVMNACEVRKALQIRAEHKYSENAVISLISGRTGK